MAAKAIIESLAVIDVEGGGLLLMKRAGGPVIATGLIGFPRVPHDFAPDHVRKGQARAQLVKESGG